MCRVWEGCHFNDILIHRWNIEKWHSHVLRIRPLSFIHLWEHQAMTLSLGQRRQWIVRNSCKEPWLWVANKKDPEWFSRKKAQRNHWCWMKYMVKNYWECPDRGYFLDKEVTVIQCVVQTWCTKDFNVRLDMKLLICYHKQSCFAHSKLLILTKKCSLSNYSFGQLQLGISAE